MVSLRVKITFSAKHRMAQGDYRPFPMPRTDISPSHRSREQSAWRRQAEAQRVLARRPAKLNVVRHASERNRWRPDTAVGHALGEARDAFGVLPLFAEVIASNEPTGAVACAGGLDVGGLLTCLPAAGEDDGPIDGRALLAVGMLRVGQSQRAEAVAGQLDIPA